MLEIIIIRYTNFLYLFEQKLLAAFDEILHSFYQPAAFQSAWNLTKYPWKVLEFLLWILLLAMINWCELSFLMTGQPNWCRHIFVFIFY